MNKIGQKPLGPFVKIRTGKLDANANDPSGKYPFFTCSRTPLHISTYSYDCECVLVAGNGDLNVKYYKGKFDAYQRTYIIESADPKVLSCKYLFWFLSTYVDQLRHGSVGGVIKFIKLGHLTNALISVPPLPEQVRIVKLLDEADELRKLRAQADQRTDALSPSVLNELFSHPDSKKWKQYTFGDPTVVTIIDGDRGVNYPKKTDFSETGDCLFLNTSNVRKGAFDFSKCDFITHKKDAQLRKGKLVREDVILTTRGTLGNSAHYDRGVKCENVRINSGMVILRANPTLLLPEYLLATLSSDSFREQVVAMTSGSAQPQLPIGILSKIKLVLPPVPLQKAIIGRIQEISAIQAEQGTSRQRLDDLFQSMFHRAFQGEL